MARSQLRASAPSAHKPPFVVQGPFVPTMSRLGRKSHRGDNQKTFGIQNTAPQQSSGEIQPVVRRQTSGGKEASRCNRQAPTIIENINRYRYRGYKLM